MRPSALRAENPKHSEEDAVRRKLIDQLSGAGPVHRKDGVFVDQARYELRVYQTYSDASGKGGAATTPCPKQVEGHVTGLDNRALWHDSTQLTLHLQSGWRLDFQIKDVGGGVTSNSGLYEAV